MTAEGPGDALPRAALLVMDVQRGIVAGHGDDRELLARIAAAAAAARGAGIPVVYVTVRFRAGHPEVSARNLLFAGHAARGALQESDPLTEIHPDVAPQPGDVVVTKRRVGAFTGSDLDVVLRSADVTDLVLAGIATSGVVLSTVRAAADLDYRLTVLADACADRDPEVHRVLLEKVFPRQAEVRTVAAWAADLGVTG